MIAEVLVVIALWCSSPTDGSAGQQQAKVKSCRDTLIKCIGDSKKPEDLILECVKKW